MALGTTVTLPVTVDIPGTRASGVIETTVTDVEEDDGSYLDSFDLMQIQVEIDESDVAYFIRAEHLVLETQGASNPAPPGDPSAIYPEFDAVVDGQVIPRVVISGPDEGPCIDEVFGDFARGATATTCDVVFAPPGADVEAAWLGETRLDLGPFPDYEAEPVLWQ